MNNELEWLPQAVRDLAHRLGARACDGGNVRLSQTGRMRQDAAASWMKFSARQTISTTSCAFEWRARTGPAGMVTVRDALIENEGALDVRALGVIPIAHLASTPAVTRGELMRYLAELALAPDTILCNAQIGWRSEGPDRLVVSAGAGDTAAEVALGLDGDGRIATVSAEDRPRAVKADFVPTPWRGRFSDYRQISGSGFLLQQRSAGSSTERRSSIGKGEWRHGGVPRVGEERRRGPLEQRRRMRTTRQ